MLNFRLDAAIVVRMEIRMSWALAQRLVARLMGGRGVYRVGQRVNKRVMDVKQVVTFSRVVDIHE
eukprot:1326953-Amorphochlora_amoeboformis.AAC.1